MDKTDKQMLLMMLAVLIVIVLLGFFVNTQLAPGYKGLSLFNISNSNQANNIDLSKTYKATFNTTQGSFTVSLDTKAAPNVINNFYNLANSGYFNSSKVYAFDQTMGIFLGHDKNGQGSTIVNENMNAVNLNLNGENISNIADQLKLHKENLYKDQDVDNNLNLSIKEFNEKFLGISYSSQVSSTQIKKYSLMSATLGNNVSSEFIIATTDTNRFDDGRRVHFGDVESGIDIIDKIAAAPINTVTINSISLSIK